MALDVETRERLDRYAKMAKAEFEENWERWSVVDVARWLDKWCDFGKTNHDRLGWILWHFTHVRQWRGKPDAKPYLS